MYVYVELGLRVSEGSNASKKYVLESGKSPEFWSKHREVQRGAESPYTDMCTNATREAFMSYCIRRKTSLQPHCSLTQYNLLII